MPSSDGTFYEYQHEYEFVIIINIHNRLMAPHIAFEEKERKKQKKKS